MKEPSQDAAFEVKDKHLRLIVLFCIRCGIDLAVRNTILMQEGAVLDLFDVLAFVDRSDEVSFVVKDRDDEFLSIGDENQALSADRIRPDVDCGADLPDKEALRGVRSGDLPSPAA